MQKRILVVSPIEWYQPFFGNSSRIAAFMQHIQALGFDFRYLHLPERPFDPAPMIANLGDNYIYQPYRPRRAVIYRLRLRAIQALFHKKSVRSVRVDDFLQRSDIRRYKKVLSDFKPHIVLINYTYFSKLFHFTPSGIEKLLDTHDSLHLRFKQLYNSAKKMQNFRISIKDEIQALNRADKVISIQRQEAAFFKTHGCTAKIYTIGHQLVYKANPIHKKRHKLLYVGARYSANIDALNHFLTHIWPLLIVQNPSLELYIAGGIGVEFQHLATTEGAIKLLGYVDDLAALYNQVDVAINPIRMGSGLKIKNIEALSNGRPVITTTLGAEGLAIFEGKGLEIAHSTQEWAIILAKFLNNDDFYGESLHALSIVIAQYNKTNEQNMRELLTD